MKQRVARWPSVALATAALALLLFLLMPVAAIFGLGLYYSFGIALVADAGELAAALAREKGIGTALWHAPIVALMVCIIATIWGTGLSLLWSRWLRQRRRHLIVLSALPFLLPRFCLGALFLLASLKLAQLGTDALGLALVTLAQCAVAAPVTAATITIGWQRVDPDWRRVALEAGSSEATIFRRLSWPVLRPYASLGALLALLISIGDFYLGNALSGDPLLLPGVILSGVARNASPLYHALVALVLVVDTVLFFFLTGRLRRLSLP